MSCSPTQIPLPSAPVWDSGNIGASILSEFVFLFQVLAYSVINLFLGLFSEIGCGLGGVAQSAFDFVNSAWTQATASLAGFGLFAPFVAVAIFGGTILLLAWFVFLIVRVSTSEMEKEGNEVEEGV